MTTSVESYTINLLFVPEVRQWMRGNLDFLPPTKTQAQRKMLEDAWGQGMVQRFRPDWVPNNQWTTHLGERIALELYTLFGYTCTRPIKMKSSNTRKKKYLLPDWEVEHFIIEVKTQTYCTGGTAVEKIPAVPLKYAEVPELYGKPLRVLCIGYAEQYCRDEGYLGEGGSAKQKQYIELCRGNQIEFIGASDLLCEFGW